MIDALELREFGRKVVLQGARVSARYGGLDAQSIWTKTNVDGIASIPNADLEWQPVVVSVQTTPVRGSTTLRDRGSLSV